MTVDARQAAEHLLALKRASNSFTGFMDYQYPEFKWPGFMREYQEVLDLMEQDALVSPGGNPIRRLLVSMPPRHAKSFNGTENFPAYCIMKKPKREIMISAYSGELATTFGRNTRSTVTDKRATKPFPGFQLSRDSRAVDFWKTIPGGAYYAVGLNGTTTGRGANILIVDDPYKSREEADSITMRKKIWSFYTAALLTRKQPDFEGQPAFEIVTHTRWHPDDMAGRIMDSPEFKRGEWMHLNFQALRKVHSGIYIRRSHLPVDDPRYVPEKADLVGDGGEKRILHNHMRENAKFVSEEKTEALWPERFPVKDLLATKAAIGEREFAALYQQSPYVLGGNIIKDKWFKRYTEETKPAEFHALILTADTAFKKSQSNDYSAFTLAGITELGDIYILRVWREKLEFPDLKRKAVMLNATYRGHGLRGLWVEDKASGQSLIQELRNNSGVSVIAWKCPTDDKVARANSVSPIIEAGRVFIPEEADWLDDWLQELSGFPAVKNDDQVDSFVIALDVGSRMVVTGYKEFSAPIGDFLKSKEFGGDLMFTGKPLAMDPSGWAGGQGGFGKATGPVEWAGWGEG